METIELIRGFAFLSIGRACLFAVLAIVTVMSGLMGWPVMAFRSGAILTMFAGAVLAIKALSAPRRNYRHTEVWILMGRRHDLPEDRAQSVFGAIIADTYWRFVNYAAASAMGLWIATLIAALLSG
jgi:heme A synthase